MAVLLYFVTETDAAPSGKTEAQMIPSRHSVRVKPRPPSEETVSHGRETGGRPLRTDVAGAESKSDKGECIEKFQMYPTKLMPSANRVASTATEQLMAWIFTCEVGEIPPPMPAIPKRELAHVAEILASENPVVPGDSKLTAEAKEAIRLAKQELRDYIEKGGDVESFFDYWRGRLVEANQIRQTSRKEVLRVLKDDPDIALDFLDRVNEDLAAKGIKGIVLHPRQLEHFGVGRRN